MELYFFSSLRSFLLDCLFPLNCIFCKQEGALCCSRCLATVGFMESRCPFCQCATEQFRTCEACKKKNALSGALSIFNYDDPKVKQIVSALKFRGHFSIIDSLKTTMIERLLGLPCDFSSSLIIPAPQRTESFKTRGYNQAALLGNMIAKELRAPFLNALGLTQQGSQHANNQTKRWDIISHIRMTRHLAKTMKNAIVVDDLLTTGATLEGCARALRNAGVPNIFGITLARQYKHSH